MNIGEKIIASEIIFIVQHFAYVKKYKLVSIKNMV